MFDQSILKPNEKAVFSMRDMFVKSGYKRFKMSKFEEYDLYSKNKEFLVSDQIITFTDTNGKLLALKPDVTLSIIKNTKFDREGVQKYYYDENVYRASENGGSYKEILQTGLECMGNISEKEIFEVISLALKSLKVISLDSVMLLADVGVFMDLLEERGIEKKDAKLVAKAISTKNDGLLKSVLSESDHKDLRVLIKNYPTDEETFSVLYSLAKSEKTKVAINNFQNLYNKIKADGNQELLKVDFSIVSVDGYYSAIVFKGFINGIAQRVLSGGQYDKLMKKMGKLGGAIGFAVYLDSLERFEEIAHCDEYVNVALPKGRLGEKVYAMFEKAGYPCPAIKENNRKLIFENADKKIRYFWVKPSDIAIYVERGSADIGVAGKDILLEYSPDVYELLDLNIGKCKMAVAAKKDFEDDESKTLKVATKFSNIAKEYYATKCRDIDIIHLNGSIEIAPILGLSDVIVDIVETGKTLLENDLVPFEDIVKISARLICNKASFGFKAQKINAIKSALSKEVKDND